MRLATVLVLTLTFSTTVAGEGFLERAAEMQPQQRDPAPGCETAGFVAVFTGIGLSVAAFDYSREVPIAPDRPDTRKEWVSTLQRPVLLWAGVGAAVSGLLMTTVWKLSDSRVAVGPGRLTIGW